MRARPDMFDDLPSNEVPQLAYRYVLGREAREFVMRPAHNCLLHQLLHRQETTDYS